MIHKPEDYRRFERYSPPWWGFIDWWRYKCPRLEVLRYPRRRYEGFEQRHIGTLFVLHLWDGPPHYGPLPAPYAGQSPRVIGTLKVPTNFPRFSR